MFRTWVCMATIKLIEPIYHQYLYIYIYIYIYIYVYIHTDTHTQYTAIETGSGYIDKGISATESCTFTSITQFLLQIHNKKIFDLESEGQLDGAEHPQLWHSLANIQICKRHHTFLRQLSPFPRYWDFKFCNLETISRGRVQ